MNKKNFDSSFAETKYTNSKENEQNIKSQNNDSSKFDESLLNVKPNNIVVSPIVENININKKLLTENNNKIDINFIKRNSSSSNNYKKIERMSSNVFEDGIMLPVQDFYDEFNKEIILTDYFSRFLALSIAIYEDEINENNLTNFKNNSNSFQNRNVNLHLNRSNALNKEIVEYDQMKKKANIDLTNIKLDFNQHTNISKIEKHNTTAEYGNNDNPLFNRQMQYREFNKKNIPERFKSQKIGISNLNNFF